jgi:hypothetical protein
VGMGGLGYTAALIKRTAGTQLRTGSCKKVSLSKVHNCGTRGGNLGNKVAALR